jgi:GT2 family glycosyltransferase
MIKSLNLCTYKNIEIIIVDNCSKNDNPYIIKELFPDIKLIVLKDNLGFAGGNNEGLKYANGEYILLLNNDTEVDPNFLEPLVEVLMNNEDAGMASPRLLYYYSPNKKTIQYAGANKINLLTGRGSNIGILEIDNGQYNFVKKTDYAHGAALIFPKKLLSILGCMTDLYFLYYEEHDWCNGMKKLGLNAYYVGHSKVYHKESVSVGKNSPLKTYYMTRNRLIYLRRNANWYKLIIALIFFTFVSTPSALLKMLKNKDLKLIKFYLIGILWNLKNFRNLKGYPQLTKNHNGNLEILGLTNQYISHKKFLNSYLSEQ